MVSTAHSIRHRTAPIHPSPHITACVLVLAVEPVLTHHVGNIPRCHHGRPLTRHGVVNLILDMLLVGTHLPAGDAVYAVVAAHTVSIGTAAVAAVGSLTPC